MPMAFGSLRLLAIGEGPVSNQALAAFFRCLLCELIIAEDKGIDLANDSLWTYRNNGVSICYGRKSHCHHREAYSSSD